MMKYVHMFVVLVIAMSITSAVWMWKKQGNVNNNQFTVVKPIKKAGNVKIKKIPVKQIEVLDKKEIVKVIPSLPSAVKENENKQVIVTGEIKPYEGTTDVVSVVDVNTGKSEMLVSQRKLPFFEFIDDKEVGVRLGFKGNVDVYARYDFLRVGGVKVGLYGEIDTLKHDNKIMLQGSYSF